MTEWQGRLNGKVILITGAGNGIGYAIAELCLQEGAKIVAVDYNEKSLEVWKNRDGVVPILADITNLEDVERMIEETESQFGRLDVLCNNAGITDLLSPLLDTEDSLWDRVINVDLKAPFRICRTALPLMLKNGGGSIINVGSYGALRGNSGLSYSAAKAGLAGLTRSIAFSYGHQGIRCNIIHPGATRTNIAEHSGAAMHQGGQEAMMKILTSMPVNWMAEPEAVAKACLFLCSDDSKHVNGAEISVDGGMSVC